MSIVQKLKEDIESVIYNQSGIKLYDIKIPFSIDKSEPYEITRKIYDKNEIEVLEVCDHSMRFVVNPDYRIQKTKNDGTVKLLRLEKGYKLFTETHESRKGPSGEVGLAIEGVGFNLKIDNLREKGFMFKIGKLTHEHLVLITDARQKRKTTGSKIDKANIIVDYIRINKKFEQMLSDGIEARKQEILAEALQSILPGSNPNLFN